MSCPATYDDLGGCSRPEGHDGKHVLAVPRGVYAMEWTDEQAARRAQERAEYDRDAPFDLGVELGKLGIKSPTNRGER